MPSSHAVSLTLLRIVFEKTFYGMKWLGILLIGLVALYWAVNWFFRGESVNVRTQAEVLAVEHKMMAEPNTLKEKAIRYLTTISRIGVSSDDGASIEHEDVRDKLFYHYTFRWHTEDGETREEELNSRSETALSYQVGDVVELSYNRLFPNIAYPVSAEEEPDAPWWVLLIIAGVGAFLMLFGWCGVWFIRFLFSHIERAIQLQQAEKEQ